MFWKAHFEGKGKGYQFALSVLYVHCRGTVLIWWHQELRECEPPVPVCGGGGGGGGGEAYALGGIKWFIFMPGVEVLKICCTVMPSLQEYPLLHCTLASSYYNYGI